MKSKLPIVCMIALVILLTAGIVAGLRVINQYADEQAEEKDFYTGIVGYGRYQEGQAAMGAGWLLITKKQNRYVLINFSEKAKAGCKNCGYEVVLKLELSPKEKYKTQKAKIIEIQKSKKLPCNAP